MADHSKSSQKNSSQRFGPYVVGETIGRGTFAKVKIAVHETTKVRVALKIIPRKVMENDSHSAIKIKREIGVMKVLRHPHITRLYDVVRTKNDIVLVLEFVSGGELFDYISKKGRLDEPTGRNLFQQLAAAVAYCHRYRVAHRDIKPENVMMEHGSHNIKLSDFGLSSVTHDGRFFETSCGTPNYASPEVVSGQLYGGPETDVWSCGVVLYAMLTGTLPFDDSNVSSLFKKIQAADYPHPRNISREAQDLLRKMLVVNPLERATMEQVMQHPWVKPRFPQYLLSLHYEAVLDTMRFSKDHTVSEDMLDEEVVRVVASRFHISTQQVVTIVTREEEKLPSMHAMVTGESENGVTVQRLYPAAHYWETFSNVLDSKLRPRPLEIPAAEVVLRDETHDVLVSYLILTQKKQNKLGPEEFAKSSFGDNASTLLVSQSMQGYGSLNANSLHQLSANSSFTGSSFAMPSNTLTRQKEGKKSADKTFLSLPDKTIASEEPTAPPDDADAWLEGYNAQAAPFLPLHSDKSSHTILGSMLKVNELPVNLMRARNIGVKVVPRVAQNTDSTASSLADSANPSFLQPYQGDGAGEPNSLLHPLSRGDSCNVSGNASANASFKGAPPGSVSARSLKGGKDSHACKESIQGETALGPETALDMLFHVEAATRFGNDFIRNGVLFRGASPREAMAVVYAALREEGMLWRVIHDYYVSCVRFPGVKLQIKMYKIAKDIQLVDVRVSVQSGMEACDVAVALLERLRRKAGPAVTKPRKKPSLLSHFSSSAGKGKTATPSSTTAFSQGKGQASSFASAQSVSSARKRD